MNAEQAGDLCQLIESLLRHGLEPGERIRAAARALALDAPLAADRCPMLKWWTGTSRTSPGITGHVTQSTPNPSHHAHLDTEELIPVSEAARRLGVTTHAVRAAARRGSLPAVKDKDGQWQIDLKDVETRHERFQRAVRADGP